MTTPTLPFAAISWRTPADAAAGRVLHGDHVRAAGAERLADEAVQRRDVGAEVALEPEVVAPRHDRHAVVAHRAGDDEPVAGAEPRVGHHPVGEGDAGGVEDDPVDLALAHHLRVAGDDGRARLARRLAPSRRRCRSRSARGKPSSRTTAQVRPRGSVAPIIARSFTVPQTASRPMSPPGKKMGCTTWESVVRTSQRSPTRSAAPSSRADEADPVHRRGELEERPPR